MKEKQKRTKRKNKHTTSFTMRFDDYTLDILERIAYDEDKSKPETIRSALKFLFLKKYGKEELEKVKRKHKPNIS